MNQILLEVIQRLARIFYQEGSLLQPVFIHAQHTMINSINSYHFLHAKERFWRLHWC